MANAIQSPYAFRIYVINSYQKLSRPEKISAQGLFTNKSSFENFLRKMIQYRIDSRFPKTEYFIE